MADAEEQPTCAICLCELEDGNMIKELRCKHIFHSECIDPWLINERAICPVCRQGVYLVEDWVGIGDFIRKYSGIAIMFRICWRRTKVGISILCLQVMVC